MILFKRCHLVFLLVLCSGQALALSTDRDQPAQIYADDIEFDFQTGVRTYIGNVTVEQGTLYIIADKLVANYDQDGNLTTATAWGNPASFKQRPDGKDTDTKGRGEKIIINELENTLTLITAAELTQGFNTARGENIVYNMATDKLSIKGGGRGASIATAGKDGEAPAQRTRPRPEPIFTEQDEQQTAESDQPPVDESAKNIAQKTEEAVEKAEATVAGSSVKKTESGRSRLILMPKKSAESALDVLDQDEEAGDDTN